MPSRNLPFLDNFDLTVSRVDKDRRHHRSKVCSVTFQNLGEIFSGENQSAGNVLTPVSFDGGRNDLIDREFRVARIDPAFADVGGGHEHGDCDRALSSPSSEDRQTRQVR